MAVREAGKGSYVATCASKVEGEHKVSVTLFKIHLSGSPFRFNFGLVSCLVTQYLLPNPYPCN